MQLATSFLPPHPSEGQLQLSVRCYTDPAHKAHRSHVIVIGTDWSVDTGHDLEAERFTLAFGGYLSCFEIAERVVPALKVYLNRQLRNELPRVSLSVAGRWMAADRVETCCAGSTSFATVTEAAAHVRGARHVAAEFRTRTTWVGMLGRKVLDAHDRKDPVQLPEDAMRLVGRQVPKAKDVIFLWEAGLTPELIEAAHAEASDGRPLSAAFYLGVLTKRPDLRWVHDTANKVPDREVHDWLVWSETAQDREEPELRGDWLRLGVSRRDLTALSQTAYRPADVRLLATRLGISPTAAGGVLADFANADCFPSVVDLIDQAVNADVGPKAVTRSTVDRLADLLKSVGITGTREQHAFALMHCGAPAVTAQIAVRVGTLRAEAIARGLHEWERERQGRQHARA